MIAWSSDWTAELSSLERKQSTDNRNSWFGPSNVLCLSVFHQITQCHTSHGPHHGNIWLCSAVYTQGPATGLSTLIGWSMWFCFCSWGGLRLHIGEAPLLSVGLWWNLGWPMRKDRVVKKRSWHHKGHRPMPVDERREGQWSVTLWMDALWCLWK
jgi:hypothetical protein